MTEIASNYRKADRVEVTTLVDNYTDIFLPDSEYVKRNPWIRENNVTRGLLADHGLSFLIEIYAGVERHRILMDGGWQDDPVPFNLETLGINLFDLDAVIVSHGHQDHFAGISNLYKKNLIPKSVPLVAHSEVFKQRYLELPDGRVSRMPQFSKTVFNFLGVVIKESSIPTLLASDLALLTGEIPMVTDFEFGFPVGRILDGTQLKPDTYIKDEQAIIINVKGKGLVIVTACSHPGIINTIQHAQKISKEKIIYGVVGGLHTTGPWEKLIPRTIEELKKYDPKIIVPAHCTGWKGINSFAKEMPEAFVLNSVGTKVIF